jgi:hypothetical protein
MANKSDIRAERLAAALRENLKRRKAKGRETEAAPPKSKAAKRPNSDPKPQ